MNRATRRRRKTRCRSLLTASAASFAIVSTDAIVMSAFGTPFPILVSASKCPPEPSISAMVKPKTAGERRDIANFLSTPPPGTCTLPPKQKSDALSAGPPNSNASQHLGHHRRHHRLLVVHLRRVRHGRRDDPARRAAELFRRGDGHDPCLGHTVLPQPTARGDL